MKNSVAVRRLEISDFAEWENSFGRRLGMQDGGEASSSVFHALLGFSRFLEAQREVACRGIFLGESLVGKLLVRGLAKQTVALEIWFLHEEFRRDLEAQVKCLCVESSREELNISRFTAETKVAFPSMERPERAGNALEWASFFGAGASISARV
jgi:hypothetical protein